MKKVVIKMVETTSHNKIMESNNQDIYGYVIFSFTTVVPKSDLGMDLT